MSDPAARATELHEVLRNTRVVVVTYGPDPDVLGRQFRRLADEQHRVVVVDNASPNVGEVDRLAAQHGFAVVRLRENVGVAAAHNAGIDAARADGADHVVLLDHDSIPDPGAIGELAGAYLRRPSAAAVGSCVVPSDEATSGSFVVGSRWFGFVRTTCPAGSDRVVDVDHLISSGTFIPLAAIDVVGPMMEWLFIDRVDTEWCLRARALGLRSYGACGARLRHTLGVGTVPVWFGRRRTPAVHAPERYFHLVRNSLWLYRRPYVPARWVSADLVRLVGATLAACLVPGRRARLRWMLRGLRAGLAGPTT